MQTSLPVHLDSIPRTISVQSSYKLNLPPYLLVHAADIKLVEPVGQGELAHYKIIGMYNIIIHAIYVMCMHALQVNLVLSTKVILLRIRGLL